MATSDVPSGAGRVSERIRTRLAHFCDPRAAAAGALASAAYAAEMYLDEAVTGYRFDDVQLLETALRGRTARVPVAGMVLHLANGAGLGLIYHAVVAPRLRGPAWVRGLAFGMLFLGTVWPLTPLVDRVHPAIRRGELPKLATPVAFGQNLARHLVFGLVLGVVDAAWHHSHTSVGRL
jgi:hypothetical protein